MLRALANWWDSVELWATQLPFPLQVVLAAAVLVPACAGLAVAADRVSDAVDSVLASVRRGLAARRDQVGDRREG